MKVALVHDYLNQYGGGERVLEDLMKIFPTAPIYTLLYDAERTMGKFEGRIGGTSFLDVPFVRRRHRPFIPLMPFAAASLNLGSEYDVVISDTAGYAKGFRSRGQVFHLCYCHTPLRFAWESESYFSNPFFKMIGAPGFLSHRIWDRRMAARPQVLIANSQFIAGKIKRYYKREVPVVYPAVAREKFYYDPRLVSRGYYLAVGRLMGYKKFDLTIRAFSQLGRSLKIVGRGPETSRLEMLARQLKAPVEFISFLADEALRKMYAEAEALVFPQIEDFGLVAAEAQACGTPVVAFRGGGALEIVKEGLSGGFFDEMKPESLASAVRRLDDVHFDRRVIAAEAERFSFQRFRDGILSFLPSSLLS